MKRLLVAMLFFIAAATARADGGHLLFREPAGPFTVSLFSTPEVLSIGDADLSAMVEERGRVLLDADVVVTLTPESGAPIVAHLTHANATNRMLEDVIVRFPHAGRWHAAIDVREGGREGHVATDLMVANHSARRRTVWFFGLLPVLAIVLFAWVQVEKRRTQRMGTRQAA